MKVQSVAPGSGLLPKARSYLRLRLMRRSGSALSQFEAMIGGSRRSPFT